MDPQFRMLLQHSWQAMEELAATISATTGTMTVSPVSMILST